MSMRTIEAFESELCEYTGAPYAVTMKRCCIALKGCMEYYRATRSSPFFGPASPFFGPGWRVYLPRFTYVFVPQTLVRSDFVVDCTGPDWSGGYQLWPYPVWDYARRFRPNMYKAGQFQCLSFHTSKILSCDTEGGAVLCDDPIAADWLRIWRNDGRADVEPPYMIGESGLMYSNTAEALSRKLHWIKQYQLTPGHPYYPNGPADLPNSDYPDLSKTDWNGLWKAQMQST